ncbi:MAG: hypothetical protein ACE15D_17020 [Candidatus Eisenbacteria bacterium]
MTGRAWRGILTSGVFCVLAVASSGECEAGTAGVLKLKIGRCGAAGWISDANVSVQIYRPGTGYVDSGYAIADDSGYVQIAFDDLEGGDEARTTVTPKGQSADSGHVYYWVPPDRGYGYFDLGIGTDSGCEDDWFDYSTNVIQCLYEAP